MNVFYCSRLPISVLSNLIRQLLVLIVLCSLLFFAKLRIIRHVYKFSMLLVNRLQLALLIYSVTFCPRSFFSFVSPINFFVQSVWNKQLKKLVFLYMKHTTALLRARRPLLRMRTAGASSLATPLSFKLEVAKVSRPKLAARGCRASHAGYAGNPLLQRMPPLKGAAFAKVSSTLADARRRRPKKKYARNRQASQPSPPLH